MKTHAANQPASADQFHVGANSPFPAGVVEAVVQLTISVFDQVPSVEFGVDPDEGFGYAKIVVRVPRDDYETARRKSVEWHASLTRLNPAGTFGLMMDFV